MKMKRVLITVDKLPDGFRYANQMQKAVDKLLASGLHSCMASSRGRSQKIIGKDGKVIAELSSCDWLPHRYGNCPPKFVLNLPAHMWRDGAPEYKGKIRRESK
jgi:hypothetical protein